MRGKSRVVTCYFCKKKIPQYKAIMSYRRLFSYKDDKYNVMYFGPSEKIWVCRSCARHRGIIDVRQKMRRNQFRERPMNRYGYVDHRKPKQKENKINKNKEIKENRNKEQNN
jgi:ribosomal protein S26